MFVPMLPVRDTIQELGAAEIAAASGFPLTTICRWRDGDRIPGKGRAHEWRVKEFEAAAARIREERRAARAAERTKRRRAA